MHWCGATRRHLRPGVLTCACRCRPHSRAPPAMSAMPAPSGPMIRARSKCRTSHQCVYPRRQACGVVYSLAPPDGAHHGGGVQACSGHSPLHSASGRSCTASWAIVECCCVILCVLCPLATFAIQLSPGQPTGWPSPHHSVRQTPVSAKITTEAQQQHSRQAGGQGAVDGAACAGRGTQRSIITHECMVISA